MISILKFTCIFTLFLCFTGKGFAQKSKTMIIFLFTN